MLVLVLCACSDPEATVVDAPTEVAAPCTAPPMGFIVWTRDGLVQVSKDMRGVRGPGGIETHAVILSFDASMLPAVADFGPEQIEVRAGPTLCLLPDGAP